ncbi:B-cell lymphoma 3-encoded protein [Colletotrichum fioriniae PJ7]|uniref:B-cell lymphoma 3-encoded protein n=1 Tax=Colletotrichum fioriniae PJ7 TaxID=1445577 RepID=A0A010RU78_9PEZI|nr:B-cell lymphoma 3-encoded protein [Colletotrichum fioriniae PJ7]
MPSTLVPGELKEQLYHLFPRPDWTKLQFTHLHMVVSGLRPLDLKLVLQQRVYRSQVNSRDVLGRTPLALAVMMGNHSAAEDLLAAGATFERCGSDLIRKAIHSRSKFCVELLLKRSANAFAVDGRGATLIHTAAAGCDNLPLMEFLLTADTRFDSPNLHGCTPLSFTPLHDNHKVASLLLSRGANVNNVDKDGDTPLTEAVRLNAHSCLRIFIESGASMKVVNKRGWTLLHFAGAYGDASTLRTLLAVSLSAEPCIDNDGETPQTLFRRRKSTSLEINHTHWEKPSVHTQVTQRQTLLIQPHQNLSTRLQQSMEGEILNAFRKTLDEVYREKLFHCSTRNCKFDAFATLAMCSRRNNITENLAKTQGNFEAPRMRYKDIGLVFRPTVFSPPSPISFRIAISSLTQTAVTLTDRLTAVDVESPMPPTWVAPPGEERSLPIGQQETIISSTFLAPSRLGYDSIKVDGITRRSFSATSYVGTLARWSQNSGGIEKNQEYGECGWVSIGLCCFEVLAASMTNEMRRVSSEEDAAFHGLRTMPSEGWRVLPLCVLGQLAVDCSAYRFVFADFLVSVVHDDQIWRTFGNAAVEEQLARDPSAWIRHERVIVQRQGLYPRT